MQEQQSNSAQDDQITLDSVSPFVGKTPPKTWLEAKQYFAGFQTTGYQGQDWPFVFYDQHYITGVPMWIRGPVPKVVTRGKFSVALGSASVFGRLVRHPFPEQLSTPEHPCINLGQTGCAPIYCRNAIEKHPIMKELLDGAAYIYLECMSPKGEPNGVYPNITLGHPWVKTNNGSESQAFPAVVRQLLSQGHVQQVESLVHTVNDSWITNMSWILERYGHKTLLLIWSAIPIEAPTFDQSQATYDMISVWPELLHKNSIDALNGLYTGKISVWQDSRDTPDANSLKSTYTGAPDNLVFSNYAYQPQTMHDKMAAAIQNYHANRSL